jgi:uridine kinase
VVVDGVDGSGKPVFAGQLAGVLREQARPVVRASVDDFHHPRVQRYRRGRSSPSGFWLDSFDYDRMRHDLLDPLGPAGSRRYRTAVHDLDTDQHLDLPWVVGPPGVVPVLDGLFLHRDELHDLWELSVFLDELLVLKLRPLCRNTDRFSLQRLGQVALALALILTVKLVKWAKRWTD